MYASYQRRILSYLIDFVLGQIMSRGTMLLLAPYIDSLYSVQLIGYVVFAIWTIFNFPFLQASRWQATLGQKLLKIKTVDIQGNTLSFWRACYRGSLLSFCPWGAFMYFFSPQKQCLYDFLSDSIVVKNEEDAPNIHRPLRQIKYSIIILLAILLFAPIVLGIVTLFRY